MNPILEEAHNEAEYIKERVKRLVPKVTPLDPQLGEKLRRVGESASEVATHIEKRSSPREG